MDARRMFYKILRDTFGLSLSSIALLFHKNHSTVFSAMNRHEALYVTDKSYMNMFDTIMLDIKGRYVGIRKNPMRDGKLKLKMLHSNEREAYDVILACYPSKAESLLFIKDNGIQDDCIVFHGDPMKLSLALAMQIVSSDEKRYVMDIMKRNANALLSVFSEPVCRYYFDYAKGEFTMVDALNSFETALSLFPSTSVGLIYVRPSL